MLERYLVPVDSGNAFLDPSTSTSDKHPGCTGFSHLPKPGSGLYIPWSDMILSQGSRQGTPLHTILTCPLKDLLLVLKGEGGMDPFMISLRSLTTVRVPMY